MQVLLRAPAHVLGLLIFALAGCGGEELTTEDPLEATADVRTVVVVSVDGLGFGDLDPDVLPELTKLFESSIRYPNHVVASTALNPSTASLHTGLYPTHHGLGTVHERGRARLQPGAVTLAELAAEAGWRTVAAVSQPQLGAGFSGFGQGFHSYDAPAPEAAAWPAAQVLNVLQPQLAEALDSDDPLVVWVEFSDPARMDEGERGERDIELLRRFLAPFRGSRPRLAAALDGLGEQGGYGELVRILGRRRGAPEYVAWRGALLQAGLARVDEALGRLGSMLADAGREQGAVWALEGSRGAVLAPPASTGGPTFQPGRARTPFVLRLPNGSAAGESPLLCSSVDVTPTLAGIMRLGAGSMDGRDLLRVPTDVPDPLPGQKRMTHAVFCEGPSLVKRAAFGPKLHVEENSLRGAAAYDREGRALLRETELESDAQNRLRDLREALMLYSVNWGFALERAAEAEAPDLGVRWRLLDGRSRDARLEQGGRGSLRPAGLGGEAILAPGAALVVETSRRDVPFSLEFTSPKAAPSALDAEQLLVGDTPLQDSWIPRLPSGRRVVWLWEEGDGPAPFDVDLVKGSSLYTRMETPGEAGREIELLLALYPPGRRGTAAGDQPELDYAGSGLEVVEYPGRKDVVRIRATTPIDLQVQEPPGRDLAIAVRIDGRPVPLSRIRRDGHRFAAPGTLAIYVPDWLAGETFELAGERRDDLPDPWLRVLRTGPAMPATSALGEDELQLLRRLGPDE